jgi:hypothetical protein
VDAELREQPAADEGTDNADDDRRRSRGRRLRVKRGGEGRRAYGSQTSQCLAPLGIREVSPRVGMASLSIFPTRLGVLTRWLSRPSGAAGRRHRSRTAGSNGRAIADSSARERCLKTGLLLRRER